jgi:hypothetical protein
MTEIFGHIGLPPDAVAACAGGVAVVLWLAHRRAAVAWQRASNATASVGILALVAAALSVGYYTYYLRGGPRIVDATYYWLQAKTFASGHLTLPLIHPSAALRGRFLYFDAARERLSVLFPPGYAAILSLGMLLHVPQLMGPCIAACLVLVTAALARRVFADSRIAVAAALLSVLCAALRYHTADTLSHGCAALLFAAALWGALGASHRDWAVAGLSAGWLLATRPVSAIALLIVIAVMLRPTSTRLWFTFGAALLPGITAWLLYQRVTTGSWFDSTQMAYYAVADGPPGCFHYGFGSNVGCQFEHGTYVGKRLPHGYGLLQALVVSSVRLRWHLLDTFNFEPLALLLLFAAKSAYRNRGARALMGSPLLLLVVYAPFYFDGNFPGGGARMLADAMPLEHVLVSGWLVTRSRLIPAIIVSLFGFALHGAFEHIQLQHREGGHPMFEPSALNRAGVSHGLILVDTDNGFALGHEPGKSDAIHSIVVARLRGDTHDWILWKNLGSPATYRYLYQVNQANSTPRLESVEYSPVTTMRFEAEAQWPVLSVRDAWAIPGYPPTPCVSRHRALIVHPSGRHPTIVVALSVPRAGRYRVGLGWVVYDTSPTMLSVTLGPNAWQTTVKESRFECGSSFGPPIDLAEGEQPLTIALESGPLAVDWIELEPAI